MSVQPTAVSPLAVTASRVTKSYGRGAASARVLRGIDLEIAQGECVILAGPSGSGKTTLLSILGCTLSADEGNVELFGRELNQLGSRALETTRREVIGFLFQRFHLVRGLTAVQNVSLPLLLQGVRKRVAKQAAIDQLRAVGLGDHLHRDPRRMSVGQCQRVALARALVGDPPLILADEPTASLDAANGDAVMRLIRQLTKERGKTAIIVSHDHRVMHYADRIFRLEEGEISAIESNSKRVNVATRPTRDPAREACPLI